MKVKLGDLIEEYSERNVDNKYKPVAVGKYGIRAREGIYTKELAKDYSKNKLIYKGTLTVGMGSNQIDIGILRDDEIYSVSPAYHTYNIKISNYDYLDYLLTANNNRMFSIYANRGSRQGKTLDLKRWLTDELRLHDEKDQKIIVQTLNVVKQLISQKEAELVKLDNLIKARFVEMFRRNNIDVISVGDAVELINGRAFKPTHWMADGLPIIRIQNLNDKTAPFNYFDGIYDKKNYVKKGELLFSWSGTPGTSFGAFIWDREPGILNQHIFRVLPKIDLELNYLRYALNDQLEIIISKAHGGVGLQHVTKGELEKVLIPNPNIEQQHSFSNFVAQVDKSKFAAKQ